MEHTYIPSTGASIRIVLVMDTVLNRMERAYVMRYMYSRLCVNFIEL